MKRGTDKPASPFYQIYKRKGIRIMQIYNNIQSPSFGQMNIDKAAEKKLSECSVDVLKKVKKAGKALRKTKFFDVEIDQNLNCKMVSSSEAYFGLFKGRVFKNVHHGKQNNILSLDDKFGVSRYGIWNNPAMCGYDLWGNQILGKLNSIEDIDTIALVAKELDRAAVKGAKGQESKSNNKIAIKLLHYILDKFGV